MNYRHVYHAGNFADIVKHSLLALILEQLKTKDKPFCVLDTHAGLGLYDLTGDEATRTGEFHQGIGRILGDPHAPEALRPYLDVVRGLNPDGLTCYPGSPWLARALLRPGDRLMACELHPDDRAALADLFAGDRAVRVFELDGYLALKSFLPFKERRGVVLIDPPFEVRDEFERLGAGLADGLRRFGTGIFIAWYPIKDRRPLTAFLARVRGLTDKWLTVEVTLRPETESTRLNGCGLLVLNPPWRLDAALEGHIMPYFSRKLADDGAGGYLVERGTGIG